MFAGSTDGLEQVLSRFINKTKHGHTGELEWKRGSVFFENDAMYSYGKHFPLVIRRSAKSNLKDGKEWYLCNGDKYSVTTSGHQNATFRHAELKDSPRLAFSALEAIGIHDGASTFRPERQERINPNDERLELVDFEPDYSAEWKKDGLTVYNPETGKYEPDGEPVEPFAEWRAKQPMGSTINTSRDSETKEIISAYAHRVGVVLFRFPKFKQVTPEIREPEPREYIVTQRAEYELVKGQYRYFLCGMDEGSYFVSELSRPVKTVGDALTTLKPHKVFQAERDGAEVLRQGDWFFIPLKHETLQKCGKETCAKGLHIADSKFKQQGLPKKAFQQNRASNTHFVRLFKQGKDLYCKGTVYHRSDNGRRADHRALRLDGMFLAVQNTSIRDWSASGRVD